MLASPSRATSIVIAADAANLSVDLSYGTLWNFSFAPSDPFALGSAADPLELTFNLSHPLTVKDYAFSWFHFSYRLLGLDFAQAVDSNQYFDFTETLTLGGVPVGTTRSSVLWGHGDTRVQMDFFEFEYPPDWVGRNFDGLTLTFETPFALNATNLNGAIGIEPAATVPETANTFVLAALGALGLLACAARRSASRHFRAAGSPQGRH